MHYGQDVLLNNRDRRDHLLLAGVGYGKTKFGPLWMERRRTDNIQSKEFLIIAPTYKLLKKRCFEEYREFLFQMGYEEKKDYTFNKSDPSFFFRGTKQNIIGVSGESPEAIVSYNTAAIWIDEAALCEHQVRKNAVKRNRCPKANYRQILHTTTPEGLNWLYELFKPDDLIAHGNGVHEYSKNKLVLHGATHDNPYLDEDYLDAIEEEFGFDSAYYENYVLGKFTSLSKNRFYFSFAESKNVDDCELDPDNRDLYLSWDSNIGQMTWVVMQSMGGIVTVVDENGSNGYNIDAACEHFIERYPPNNYAGYNIIVLGDAALWARSAHSYQKGYDIIMDKLRAEYPRVECRAHRANPFVEERSRNTNKLLAQGRLRISSKCKKVIQSAKGAESDGKGGIKKGSKDIITHAMEAVDMGLMILSPLRVRDSGRSQGTSW